MVRFTPEAAAAHEAKMRGNQMAKRAHLLAGETLREAVPLEIPLHNQIIEHCDKQWPRWKYIHAAPYRRSTIAPGCQDFTVFMPNKKLVLVECKARDEKPDRDQQIWIKEMAMLGFEVAVVRSFEGFLDAAKRAQSN